MKSVAIIGGGFSGTMTALHLLRKCPAQFSLTIINDGESFNRGIAFSPYSKQHLLNVPACRMGAFNSNPEDFLNWVLQQKSYKEYDRNVVSNSFLPRYLYGEYMQNLWNAHKPLMEEHAVEVIDACVEDLDLSREGYTLTLSNGRSITADHCVVASGNHIPGNPKISDPTFFKSAHYFQNPWKAECVTDAGPKLPVLIIGNGLTMVDTVLGLLEQGFQGDIYSISPNGFNILPHRHGGLSYSKLTQELPAHPSLLEIVRLFNKHMKIIRQFGLSAEPLIDSLRPLTQSLWLNMTTQEKKTFMSRLRHLWGVARHRIPLHIHDKIQQLRIAGRLHIFSGSFKNIVEDKEGVHVEFYNKRSHQVERVIVSRVINCTGPETDLSRLTKCFLKKCFEKGIVDQDPLKLGINAHPTTFNVINRNGEQHKNLFTVGTNLKGMLWESTAVSELRVQAEIIADTIVKSIREESVDELKLSA